MTFIELAGELSIKIATWQQIADADKRLAVCRAAQGRIEGYKEILDLIRAQVTYEQM